MHQEAQFLVEQQMKPGVLYQGFIGTLRRSARALQNLPDSITRALKRVGDGDLRMTVRPAGFDPLMSRIEQAVDRPSLPGALPSARGSVMA